MKATRRRWNWEACLTLEQWLEDSFRHWPLAVPTELQDAVAANLAERVVTCVTLYYAKDDDAEPNETWHAMVVLTGEIYTVVDGWLYRYADLAAWTSHWPPAEKVTPDDETGIIKEW